MVIIGIILFSVGAFICVSVNGGSLTSLVGTLLITVGTAIAISSSSVDSPSAIDVYRGKTTLEITSVNGVPTDSAVVYKKK